MKQPDTLQIELYIGGLPKHAREEHIIDYLKEYGRGFQVTLIYRLNGSDCRGYGSIWCSSPALANAILEDTHQLYGRKIVIEKQKTREELLRKYLDLVERKVLILAPKKKRNKKRLFPTQDALLDFFSIFGEIENAKIFKHVQYIDGAAFHAASITFADKKDCLAMKQSKQARSGKFTVQKSREVITKLQRIQENQRPTFDFVSPDYTRQDLDIQQPNSSETQTYMYENLRQGTFVPESNDLPLPLPPSHQRLAGQNPHTNKEKNPTFLPRPRSIQHKQREQQDKPSLQTQAKGFIYLETRSFPYFQRKQEISSTELESIKNRELKQAIQKGAGSKAQLLTEVRVLAHFGLQVTQDCFLVLNQGFHAPQSIYPNKRC